MKLLCALGATLLLGSAPGPARPIPEVADGAAEMIVCGDRAGTAFRIGPTRLISAAHVTEGGPCTIGMEPLVVVREDGRLDVAELRAPTPGPFLRMDCRGFRGDRAYRAIGWGGGLRVNLPLRSTGLRQPDGKAEFYGEVYPGMSGGPVIDSRGRVVGVTQMRWPARARALRDTWACGDVS